MLYPVTVTTNGDIQVMTPSEFNAFADYVLEEISTNNGPGNIYASNPGSGTLIGSFTDTSYAGAIGSGDATLLTTTTDFYQDLTTPSGTEPPTLLVYDSNRVALRKMSATEADGLVANILNYCVTQEAPASYQLQTSAPSGGTWFVVGTLSEKYTPSLSTTYNLYKKLSNGTTPIRPLKVWTDGSQVNAQRLTNSEIQFFAKKVREKIISSGVGKYALQASAPGTGTWVAKGTISDIRPTTSPQNYEGSSFSTNYDSSYDTDYDTAYTTTYDTSSYESIDQTYAGSYASGYAGFFGVNYESITGTTNYNLDETDRAYDSFIASQYSLDYLGDGSTYNNVTLFYDAALYYNTTVSYQANYVGPTAFYSGDRYNGPITYLDYNGYVAPTEPPGGQFGVFNVLYYYIGAPSDFTQNSYESGDFFDDSAYYIGSYQLDQNYTSDAVISQAVYSGALFTDYTGPATNSYGGAGTDPIYIQESSFDNSYAGPGILYSTATQYVNDYFIGGYESTELPYDNVGTITTYTGPVQPAIYTQTYQGPDGSFPYQGPSTFYGPGTSSYEKDSFIGPTTEFSTTNYENAYQGSGASYTLSYTLDQYISTYSSEEGYSGEGSIFGGYAGSTYSTLAYYIGSVQYDSFFGETEIGYSQINFAGYLGGIYVTDLLYVADTGEVTYGGYSRSDETNINYVLGEYFGPGNYQQTVPTFAVYAGEQTDYVTAAYIGSGIFDTNYTTDATYVGPTFDSDYTASYTTSYVTSYQNTYAGTYAGVIINNDSTTISSLTLWRRIA